MRSSCLKTEPVVFDAPQSFQVSSFQVLVDSGYFGTRRRSSSEDFLFYPLNWWRQCLCSFADRPSPSGILNPKLRQSGEKGSHYNYRGGKAIFTPLDRLVLFFLTGDNKSILADVGVFLGLEFFRLGGKKCYKVLLLGVESLGS